MRRALPSLLVAVVLALSFTSAGAEIIVVSDSLSPIRTLTREQAEQLYLGRTRSLPDGIAVGLVDLPAGTVRDRFYELLTGKNPSQTRAYWSRQVFTGRALPPKEAGSVAEAIAWVAANPSLIAYLPESAATDKRLRVLLRLP